MPIQFGSMNISVDYDLSPSGILTSTSAQREKPIRDPDHLEIYFSIYPNLYYSEDDPFQPEYNPFKQSDLYLNSISVGHSLEVAEASREIAKTGYLKVEKIYSALEDAIQSVSIEQLFCESSRSRRPLALSRTKIQQLLKSLYDKLNCKKAVSYTQWRQWQGFYHVPAAVVETTGNLDAEPVREPDSPDYQPPTSILPEIFARRKRANPDLTEAQFYGFPF